MKRSLLVVTLAASSGCIFPPPDKGPWETGWWDTGLPGPMMAPVCMGDVDLAFPYDRVTAYCATGTGPGMPMGFESVVPAAGGAYTEAADANLSLYNATTHTFRMVVHHSNGMTVPLLSDDTNDGNVWQDQFATPCSSYSFTGHNFLVSDGVQQAWAIRSGPTCGLSLAPNAFAPTGKVPTGPQSCTPGEAVFDLASRRVMAVANDQITAMWVSPMERVVQSFPERAWLRELEVVSWGTADKVHLGEFSKSLGLSNGHFSGGTTVPKPAQGSTIRTFAAGTLPMSTMVGVEGVFTGQPSEMPVVRMRWTCESTPANPHAIPVTGFTPHVTTMLAGYPIQQRMVFWVASDNSSIRFAPEGRYPDHVISKLTPAAAGGWTFNLPLESYGARFTGRLVPFGNSYKMQDGVVTMGTVTTPLPVKTLQRL